MVNQVPNTQNQNSMFKRGRGRPPGATHALKKLAGVYITPKLHTKAQILAAEKEMTLSEYLRGFIERGIEAEVRQ
jgi:hypothetical protein